MGGSSEPFEPPLPTPLHVCVKKIIVYSIARKYPDIAMLQVRYCMVRRYHIRLTSQKLMKRQDGQKTQAISYAISLQTLVHLI